jgi:hypothetical protein
MLAVGLNAEGIVDVMERIASLYGERWVHWRGTTLWAGTTPGPRHQRSNLSMYNH